MKLFEKRQAYVVVRDGQVVERSLGKDYRDDLYVEWGSITKTVTAAAIGALVDRGELAYDTPARDIVGGRLPPSVTTDALCRHTSGLPRVHPGMKAGVNHDPYEDTGPELLTSFLADFESSMLEKPGENSYSNLGYAVLGRVIELLTAASWIDAVRDLVLDPWGLSDVTDRPPSDRIAAINGFGGKPHQPWQLAGSIYAPAGALWSRLDGLVEYGMATLERGGFEDPRRGWQRTEQRWWHNGQTRDAGSCLVLEPAADLVVVTHTLARLPGAADRLADRLVRQLAA